MKDIEDLAPNLEAASKQCERALSATSRKPRRSGDPFQIGLRVSFAGDLDWILYYGRSYVSHMQSEDLEPGLPS